MYRISCSISCFCLIIIKPSYHSLRYKAYYLIERLRADGNISVADYDQLTGDPAPIIVLTIVFLLLHWILMLAGGWKIIYALHFSKLVAL